MGRSSGASRVALFNRPCPYRENLKWEISVVTLVGIAWIVTIVGIVAIVTFVLIAPIVRIARILTVKRVG